MRKLASIRKIAEIKSIPNADKICAYRVDGWWVVDSVGKYKVDDLVVYAEPDSWVPTELAPFLSRGNEPREFNGVKGERLRTVKLRGQLSQGLLIAGVPCSTGLMVKQTGQAAQHIFQEGDDVTEWLGIQKWEPPVNPQLAGQVQSNFPSAFAKSDQERVQNIDIEQYQGLAFQITEKLDGSSMSVYFLEDKAGVCSRNLALKEDDANTFWSTAKKQNLLAIAERLSKEFGKGVMLQGELVGPGIQGNSYNLTEHKFFLYNIQLEEQEFLPPELVSNLANRYAILHVPVLQEALTLSMNRDELLDYAEGKSALNHKAEREGVVLKAFGMSGAFTLQFKAISNRWLLKGGD